MPHPTIQTNSFSRVDHLSRTKGLSRQMLTKSGSPSGPSLAKDLSHWNFLNVKQLILEVPTIYIYISCSSPPISISINIILNSYAQGQTYPDFLVNHGSLISGADCGHRSHQSGPAKPCAVLRPATQIWHVSRCAVARSHGNLTRTYRSSLHGSLALFPDHGLLSKRTKHVRLHDHSAHLNTSVSQTSTLPIASKHTWLTSPLWRPKAAEWVMCGWLVVGHQPAGISFPYSSQALSDFLHHSDVQKRCIFCQLHECVQS